MPRRSSTDAYGRFLELNPELLTRLHRVADEGRVDAQRTRRRGLRPRASSINSATLHERVEPVLDDLGTSSTATRATGRGSRNALERVRDGDHDWFAKPMIDSYHTVWFQLHEDLLNTLGIERSKEAARS